MHLQRDPLKWEGGARPGRGRGAPGVGLEALAEVLPGGGNRDGGDIVSGASSGGVGGGSAPPTPQGEASPGGRGAPSPSSRRVPASQAAVPPVPGRERRGKGLGAGKGDPEPAVRRRSGLQLVPLCHRLPRAGDHVLPVLHLAGTALPGQVNLRERHPWSHRGRSIPVPSPPNCSSPAFPGWARSRAIFIPRFSIWRRGKARVPALAAAAATSGSRCHRSGSADHRRRAGMERGSPLIMRSEGISGPRATAGF